MVPAKLNLINIAMDRQALREAEDAVKRAAKEAQRQVAELIVTALPHVWNQLSKIFLSLSVRKGPNCDEERSIT